MWASLVAAHRLSSCTGRAQYLWHTGLVAHSMWDLPRPGMKHLSLSAPSLILHQWLRGKFGLGHYWSVQFLTRKLTPCIEGSKTWVIGNHTASKTKTSWSLFPLLHLGGSQADHDHLCGAEPPLCSASSWRPSPSSCVDPSRTPAPLHLQLSILPLSWPHSPLLTGIKRTELKVGELAKILSYLFFILAMLHDL